MNPLEDTPKALRPLHKELWGMNCSVCDKPWARWGSGPANAKTLEPICSICFLYKSAWGKHNATLISWSIEQAEQQAKVNGIEIPRDEDGHLTSPQDGDRILAALCLDVRANWLKARRARADGGRN